MTQPPAELSINTLTQRFKSRSEARNIEKEDQIALAPYPQHQQLEPQVPLYIKHQEITYTVIVYIQMAFNIIISSTVIYLFINIILVVRQDFSLKAKEHLDGIYTRQRPVLF